MQRFHETKKSFWGYRHFKAKMKDEEKASGIECDLSEVEKALEEIPKKKLQLKTP